VSLLPLLEPTISNPFTKSEFYQLATYFGFKSFITLHPVVQGGVISAFLLCWFLLSCAVSWLFAVPVTFSSACVVALPIWFARLVNAIAPQQNFYGFTIIAYIMVGLLLSQM
jgi:hypothetical protein